MKWKYLSEKDVGCERIIRVFLWFPKELQGEGRWLEWANIHQRVCRTIGGAMWVDMAFTEKEPTDAP